MKSLTVFKSAKRFPFLHTMLLALSRCYYFDGTIIVIAGHGAMTAAWPVACLSCCTIIHMFLSPPQGPTPRDWDGAHVNIAQSHGSLHLPATHMMQHCLITVLSRLCTNMSLRNEWVSYTLHSTDPAITTSDMGINMAKFLTTIMQRPLRCRHRMLWHVSHGPCGVHAQGSSSSNATCNEHSWTLSRWSSMLGSL